MGPEISRSGIVSDFVRADADESTRVDRRPKTTLRIGGNVELLVYAAQSGALLERQVTKNLVVKAGRNVFRDLVLTPFGAVGAPPNYIAVGSDNTPVADSQTALSAEVFRKLITRRNTGDSAFTLQLFIDGTEANGSGSQSLKEAAVFVYPGGAPMVARTVFATITKTSAVQVVVNWQFNLAAS